MPSINYSVLPNFYVIGAAKSGTTTIAKGLRQHPKIYIPGIKELAYFNEENHFKQGISYLQSFYNERDSFQLRGDASPQYLYCEHVPERIKNLYEERKLKFIVILRDPFKRTISSYRQACVRGNERLNFNDAINKEITDRLYKQSKNVHCRTLGAYIGASLYYRQLKHWFNYFPKQSFLILLTDDLSVSPNRIFQKIFTFLEIETPKHIDFSTKSNQATIPYSRFINYCVRGNFLLKLISKICLSQQTRYRIKQKIDKINMRKKKYDIIISFETKEIIYKLLKEDVSNLEKLTDKNLSCWTDRYI